MSSWSTVRISSSWAEACWAQKIARPRRTGIGKKHGRRMRRGLDDGIMIKMYRSMKTRGKRRTKVRKYRPGSRTCLSSNADKGDKTDCIFLCAYTYVYMYQVFFLFLSAYITHAELGLRARKKQKISPSKGAVHKTDCIFLYAVTVCVHTCIRYFSSSYLHKSYITIYTHRPRLRERKKKNPPKKRFLPSKNSNLNPPSSQPQNSNSSPSD